MRNRRFNLRDERGVSEVLGYSLIFGLILISITAVSVGGVDSLQSVRDSEQMNNAEMAFEVLADNTADIYESNAPSRATEFSLGQSALFTGTNTTISILDDGTFKENFTTTPLVFRSSEGNEIVYEAGAIFRTRRDSGRIVKAPPHDWSGSQPILLIVGTYTVNTQSVAGTDVIARMKARDRRIAFDADDTFSNATIEVNSTRADLWLRYLEDQPTIDGCNKKSQRVTLCDIDDSTVTNLLVAVHEIEMDLEQ